LKRVFSRYVLILLVLLSVFSSVKPAQAQIVNFSYGHYYAKCPPEYESVARRWVEDVNDYAYPVMVEVLGFQPQINQYIVEFKLAGGAGYYDGVNTIDGVTGGHIVLDLGLLETLPVYPDDLVGGLAYETIHGFLMPFKFPPYVSEITVLNWDESFDIIFEVELASRLGLESFVDILYNGFYSVEAFKHFGVLWDIWFQYGWTPIQKLFQTIKDRDPTFLPTTTLKLCYDLSMLADANLAPVFRIKDLNIPYDFLYDLTVSATDQNNNPVQSASLELSWSDGTAFLKDTLDSNGALVFKKLPNTSLKIAAPSISGYIFNRWETSGDITVSSSTSQVITFTLNNDAMLSAIYIHDLTPPSISDVKYSPEVVTPEEQVTITASVVDTETGIELVKLKYSLDNGATWNSISMSLSSGLTYVGTIPKQADGTSILFKIYAEDKMGHSIESPVFSYTVRSIDSDNDGISDDDEVKIYHTDPKRPDTDDDGLTDYYEFFISYTDPLETDSDHDGLNDGAEIARGTNPLKIDTDDDFWNDSIDPMPTNFFIPNFVIVAVLGGIGIPLLFVRRKRHVQRVIASPTTANASPSPLPSSSAPVAPRTAYCLSCGAILLPRAAFCPRCGRRIE